MQNCALVSLPNQTGFSLHFSDPENTLTRNKIFYLISSLSLFWYSLVYCSARLKASTRLALRASLLLTASLARSARFSACRLRFLSTVSGTAGNFLSGIVIPEKSAGWLTSHGSIKYCLLSLRHSRHGADNVGIPRVGDGEGAHAEVLAARRAKLVVVPRVVVNTSLLGRFKSKLKFH